MNCSSQLEFYHRKNLKSLLTSHPCSQQHAFLYRVFDLTSIAILSSRPLVEQPGSNVNQFNPTPDFFNVGWSAVPEEKASRYRLTIKDIQAQDSGTYTCASPRGLTNSIVIVVAGG